MATVLRIIFLDIDGVLNGHEWDADAKQLCISRRTEMSTRAMRIGAIVFFGSFLALAVWGLGTGVGDRDLHIIAIIMNSMFLLRSWS